MTSNELRQLAEDFIDDLVEYRLNSGISQAEIAHRAGLRQSSVSRFEHAHRSPRLETIIRYIDALGLELTFARRA